MKKMLLLLGLLVLGTGCGHVPPGFAGEWLEDATDSRPGQWRVALHFDSISTVRYGPYREAPGVVDAEALQSDAYFLFDGWRKAQFGGVIAWIDESDRLHAATGDGPERSFTRVRGRSIFPPYVTLPQFAGGG
jgi:hypothetical protein